MKNIYTFFAIACIGLWGCNKETNGLKEPKMAEIATMISTQNGTYDDAEFLNTLCKNAILPAQHYIYVDGDWELMSPMPDGASYATCVAFDNGVAHLYTTSNAEPSFGMVYLTYEYEYDVKQNTITWYYNDIYQGESKIQYFDNYTLVIDGAYPVGYDSTNSRYILNFDAAKREELLNSGIEEWTGV